MGQTVTKGPSEAVSRALSFSSPHIRGLWNFTAQVLAESIQDSWKGWMEAVQMPPSKPVSILIFRTVVKAFPMTGSN